MKFFSKFLPILLVVLAACGGASSDEEAILAPEGPAFIMFYTVA